MIYVLIGFENLYDKFLSFCQVNPGISTRDSHRTVRDGLPSYGSYYPTIDFVSSIPRAKIGLGFLC